MSTKKSYNAIHLSAGLLVLLIGSLDLGGYGTLEAQALSANAHFQRAEELVGQNNDARAEEEYRLAIVSNGGRYPEASLQLSSLLCRKLDFAGAAKALQDYISGTPGEDHEGDSEDLARIREARRLQVLVERSRKPALSDLLAFVQIAYQGGAQSAEKWALRTVDLYPQSVEARLALAKAEEAGHSANALADFNEAVRLDPRSAEAHSSLGLHYLWFGGGAAAAAQEFETALTLSGNRDETAWQGLGFVYSMQGRKEDAIKAFKNYLRWRKTPSQYDTVIELKIKELESSDR